MYGYRTDDYSAARIEAGRRIEDAIRILWAPHTKCGRSDVEPSFEKVEKEAKRLVERALRNHKEDILIDTVDNDDSSIL